MLATVTATFGAKLRKVKTSALHLFFATTITKHSIEYCDHIIAANSIIPTSSDWLSAYEPKICHSVATITIVLTTQTARFHSTTPTELFVTIPSPKFGRCMASDIRIEIDHCAMEADTHTSAKMGNADVYSCLVHPMTPIL